jgi:hypothetical protein
MTRIAGTVHLVEVMSELARRRPVFHSEADFQFAFAQTITGMDPSIECRLEVPVASTRTGRTEYLDLLCFSPRGATPIEFKYFTRGWRGTSQGEEFALRNQAATDLLRLHFIHDVVRLEHSSRESPGLALLLTNEPALWSKSSKRTRDWEFHLHDGRSLAGQLLWADGTYEANTRVLRGSYVMDWMDYCRIGDKRGGQLRYLAIEVTPSGPTAS